MLSYIQRYRHVVILVTIFFFHGILYPVSFVRDQYNAYVQDNVEGRVLR